MRVIIYFISRNRSKQIAFESSEKMLQLYYMLASPPSRAVLQTIRVLGVDVEVKNIDLRKGEQMTPEYLTINPMHQVPALVDGDFVVVESRAIMAYLVNSRKPGSSWYPSDPKARALVDQRLYFDTVNFFELAASILVSFFCFEDVRTDFFFISVRFYCTANQMSRPTKLRS